MNEAVMIHNQIKNAKIKSTELGGDDYYSFWLYLDYGNSSGQGFGGFALGGKFTDFVIRQILQVVGVSSWEKLPGKPIRVQVIDGKIVAIGHYLDDVWFNPSKWPEEE